MHTTSGRWQYGLFLALNTALFWGILPIALKGILINLDAMTVTWFRFLVAAICVGIYRLLKARKPSFKRLTLPLSGLLCITIFGLSGNYIFNLLGLDKTTPSSAQVVIQLAPMLLLIGSLILFKERLNRWQWFGLLLFLTGLGLFFNQRFDEIDSQSKQYTIGIIYIIIAAFSWAAYALAQKQLLKNFRSNEIMLLIYIAGSFIFLPNSHPEQLLTLDKISWGLLLFCSINTIVAYGCFAEALDHLEASRVSAILAITPLLTIIFMQLTEHLYPGYIVIESLNFLSLFGAVIIVLGSMITALSNSKNR